MKYFVVVKEKEAHLSKNYDFGTIGLRSILRTLEHSTESNVKKKLAMVVLDEGLTKPSAIGHVLALAALKLVYNL